MLDAQIKPGTIGVMIRLTQFRRFQRWSND